MFRIFANSVDVTEHVEYGSVRIREQLNNRSNTCDFVSDLEKIQAAENVQVFEVMELVAQANSGQPDLYVDDTYEYNEIFRPGDELILDIKGTNEQYVTILSIDHTNKIITLTANLAVTIAKGTFIGRLVFGGSTERNPEQQIGYLDAFTYDVALADYTVTMNRQVIVETFTDQYMREIVGLSAYEFMANDDSKILDRFESARTQSGVGLAMVNESTDKIQGTYAQKTGTTGAGVAKWTKTLGVAVDLSTMEHVRLWYKQTVGTGVKVTAMKVRVGNDSSNYMERDATWLGVYEEDCRNYDAYEILRATIVGTVNMSTIDWLQIEVTCNAAIASGGLIFDDMFSTLGGFTITDVIRGDRKFEDVRAQYRKPSEFIDTMCKQQGIFWYVDYFRVIHIFKSNALPAAFDIDDTSQNYGDMTATADVSMLRNRVTVRGGEAPQTFRYTQDEVTDGLLESWLLDYKPKDLEIYVATQDKTITGATRLAGVATITSATHGYSNGDEVAITDLIPNGYNGSYIVANSLTNTFQVQIAVNPGSYVSGGKVGKFIQKTVGVENLVDASTVDYVYNFNEKVVRRASADILPKGAVIRRYYFPYQPIRVRVQSSPSIAYMKSIAGGNGIFDGPVINDNSILTFQEARTRAQSEVNAYANAIITINFVTDKAGLKAGQIIHITDTSRGIDADFLIQKITRKSKKGAISTYAVEAGSTMFGLIEFFQLLLKKTANLMIDVSELVDIVINDDETISMTDAVSTDVQTNVFTAALKKTTWIDFVCNAGSRLYSAGNGYILHTNGVNNNEWMAEFAGSAQGTVGFDASSGYNDGKSLYISGTTMGAGKSIKAISEKMGLTPSTVYDITYWVQNKLSDGTVGGNGIGLVLKQYTNINDFTAVATTTLLSNYTSHHDFRNLATSFTSNAAGNFFTLELTLSESTGKISLGEVRLIPNTVETQTQPGIASFSEAS